MAIAAVLILLNRPPDEADIENNYADVPQSGTVLGESTAPVTFVEYADFQCSFCAHFARDVAPQLIEDYVIPGHITFEFRDYPFLGGDDLESPGNESIQAAEAAACAMDEGEYWEFNHMLFEQHDGVNQGAFANDNLKRIAGKLGLDQDAFDTCLDTGVHQDEVIAAFASAQEAGINSTPSFVTNDQVVQYTTQGYDRLQEQIDAAIAGEPIPQ